MPVRLTRLSRRPPPPAQLLLCCALAWLALPGLASAKRTPPLETIPEWVHLSIVWNTLTDHSSGRLFSEERLHQLVPEMDRTEGDLKALVAQKALPSDTAGLLRTVLEERYRYVEQHCYSTAVRTEFTRLEGAEAASHWIVETQLDLLRQPLAVGSLTAAVEQSDRKLQQTVQSTLTNELSFQWRCREARADFPQQPRQLDAKEAQDPTGPPAGKGAQDQKGAQGEKQARDQDAERRRLEIARFKRQQALVEAYEQHRIRADRAIARLVPYLIRLTLTPSPTPQLDETAQPPLFPY